MTILVFIVLSLGVLFADISTRKPGPESLSRSIAASLTYVITAMIFAAYLYFVEGGARATLFLSAYTIEKAMSMDNLIIFSAVFSYFGVQPEYEYRVLHWGIIGSAVLRFIFIAAGLALVFVFGRLLDLAFGVFVIYTAYKMLGSTDAEQIDHNSRWYIRWTKKILPVSPIMNGQFFIREKLGFNIGYPAATPLFFCLLAVEFTDIAFAFDSVPAVIGLTRDTVLAYSSVMFAVLGLRSMYFVLEALKQYTEALSKAVICILLFVGGKMALHGLLNIEIPAYATLAIILICLAGGIIASVLNLESF